MLTNDLTITLDIVFFHIRQDHYIFICNKEDCIFPMNPTYPMLHTFLYHIYNQGHFSPVIEASP